MRDLWFLNEGFEEEIFLFLATPLPKACWGRHSRAGKGRVQFDVEQQAQRRGLSASAGALC